MIKVSDYVFKYLMEEGVRHAFTLTGGGIMHLVDSLGRSGIEYVCCHHEQTASIAAQAYDMYKEQLSVCLVTTGPGGTNALTGAAAAFVDSTPVIYMTGQVKRSDFAGLRGVRQFGAQENDIVSMAKPITKYAVTVMDAKDIAYELEKAVFIATHGRKGPVWVDIPLDVQAEMIDETSIAHFNPECEFTETVPEPEGDVFKQKRENLSAIVNPREAASKAKDMLLQAKRPLLYIGQGAVSSNSYDLIREIVSRIHIPVMATWRALDFMGTDEDGFFGSPGLQATRYSNLIMQNCDCLIVLGSRLDNMITAFNEEHFAPLAQKMIVDIDINEVSKLEMRNVTPVIMDCKRFTQALLDAVHSGFEADFENWMKSCNTVKEMFPLLAEKQDKVEFVNLYKVTDEVSRHCESEDCIVISSTSRCNTAGHIAFHHKRGQKTISSMGMGSMGFAIPSAIGAFYANEKKRVVVFEGDGSLQLNMQELAVISGNHINAKMFIFDNLGYAAITTMQDRNFDGFYVGSNEMSGLHMPSLKKLAAAYEIPYFLIDRDEDVEPIVKQAMETEGPVLVDVKGSLWFDEIPKCISSVDKRTGKRVSAFLENPYPYLSDEQLEEVQTLLRNS